MYIQVAEAYLENPIPELLVRMCIHHRSSRPLHVRSISSALTHTTRAERAHCSTRRRNIVKGSWGHWHLTQGKPSMVVTKWMVNLLHIEWQQTKALIRSTPSIPALN